MIEKEYTEEHLAIQYVDQSNLKIQFVVFPSLTATKGTAYEIEWQQFCAVMGGLEILTNKRDAKLWSPCQLKDNTRANINVITVTALVFDVDHGAEVFSFSELKQLVGARAGFIHTTYSHSAEQPRYRLVYQLKKPIPANDYVAKRSAFLDMHPELAKIVDPACKDPSRSYFRYSCHRDNINSARFEVLNGDPVDPDDLTISAQVSIKNICKSGELNYLNIGAIDLSVNDAIIGRTAFLDTPENVRKVQAALSFISADCSYPEWRDMLFALKSTKWTCAEDIGRQWSKTAPNRWDETAFDTLWVNAKADGPITLGTLFHKAKLAWFDDVSGEQYAPYDVPSSLMPQNAAQPLFNLANGQLSLSNTPPPARDYVFADCVIPGTLSIFSGLGGTAKTTALMQIAVQGALGKGWNRFQVAEFSSALFLGEECNEERDRRIGAICKDFNEADKQKVTSRIRCYAAAGKDLRLTATVQNNLLETALAREVIGLIEAQNQESDTPVRLVVFDHARLVMSGDAVDAGDVTQLTRVLTDIAIKTHTAVVLLGHSPKSAIAKDTSSDSSEIFGSTAFVDNARAAFVLHTMRENEGKTYGIAANERKDYVCLTTVKANYGASNVSWWFKKVFIDDWQTIQLDPVMLYDQNVFSKHSKLSQSLIDLVSKHPAQLTERKIRERAGLKGELKASESSVRNSLNRLLEEGHIEKRAPTKDEVTQYKLSANVKEVLVLPTNAAG